MNGSAYNNAPDGINSETPDLPEFYNFFPRSNQGFVRSHYSAHDWIADGALRLLIGENADGAADWSWLMHNVNDISPQWSNSYSIGGSHNTVRAYILYLFGTQLPDMDPKKKEQARPHRHPQYIDLWENEGEVVGNNMYGLGTWVGRTDYQTFHWTAFPQEGGGYSFVPNVKSGLNAPWYAHKLADAAIECLAYDEERDNNLRYSKVEAGASYLGAMTHYIVDVACPPHLIAEAENYYVYKRYHNWFEEQSSQYALWDQEFAGPDGLAQLDSFYMMNPAIIGKDGHNILPLPPQLALTEMASRGIEISYGLVEEQGLFIGDSRVGLIDSWSWTLENRDSTQIITPGALTYMAYYDKVELLLNYAVYYTAQAMKWVIQEVKNRGGVDPDRWAQSPYIEIYPDEGAIMPEDVPKPQRLERDDLYKNQDYLNIETIARLGAMLAPIMAIVIIPLVAKSVKAKKVITI